MKIYLFIICFFLTNLSYSSSSTYQIIDSVAVDTNGCKYHYPVLVSEAPDSSVKKINGLLRNYFKLLYEEGVCNCRYSILFFSDSLVCFEFRVGNQLKGLNYTSLCIDPTKAQLVLPIPFLDVNKLHPFVKKYYREKADENYGSKAYYYGGGGGATLVYGITKNKLVLYMGGEGHLYGYERLEIPFKKLGCHIYKMNEEEIESYIKKYGQEIIPANYGSLLLID